jgi:alkyl hydroperoxide reductase subunit AhpC
LADTEKAVARAYGTLGPLGIPRRSIFVIDASGVVRYVHRALVGVTFRPVDELIGAISAANA